jgi:hypothetical protein
VERPHSKTDLKIERSKAVEEMVVCVYALAKPTNDGSSSSQDIISRGLTPLSSTPWVRRYARTQISLNVVCHLSCHVMSYNVVSFLVTSHVISHFISHVTFHTTYVTISHAHKSESAPKPKFHHNRTQTLNFPCHGVTFAQRCLMHTTHLLYLC